MYHLLWGRRHWTEVVSCRYLNLCDPLIRTSVQHRFGINNVLIYNVSEHGCLMQPCYCRFAAIQASSSMLASSPPSCLLRFAGGSSPGLDANPMLCRCSAACRVLPISAKARCARRILPEAAPAVAAGAGTVDCVPAAPPLLSSTPAAMPAGAAPKAAGCAAGDGDVGAATAPVPSAGAAGAAAVR